MSKASTHRDHVSIFITYIDMTYAVQVVCRARSKKLTLRAEIDRILGEGAAKAEAISAPVVAKAREIMGIILSR